MWYTNEMHAPYSDPIQGLTVRAKCKALLQAQDKKLFSFFYAWA